MSLAFDELDLSSIEKVIVLDHLLPLEKDSLFFHSENNGKSSISFNGPLSIHPSTISFIPPGTGESFIQAGIQNTVVITGYDKTYLTQYAGSVYSEIVDDPINTIAMIADTVYQYILTELEVESPTITDYSYLHSLTQCLVSSGNCTIIEEVMYYAPNTISSQLNKRPLNKFSGTFDVFHMIAGCSTCRLVIIPCLR